MTDHGEMRWDGDDTDWTAMHACEKWVKAEGYSIGPTDRTHCRGVLFEPGVRIAKWHSLTPTERAGCDAVVVGSNRNGPLTLQMPAPASPRSTIEAIIDAHQIDGAA